MNKILCLIVTCSISLITYAQAENGQRINWNTNLSWDRLLEKAQAENKLIFLDCYATWCVPCKEMDEFVYTNEEVGEYFNRNFISLKLQMNKTDRDAPEVRASYSQCEAIDQQYKITAFPTFLFFDAKGTIVHRAYGFQSKDNLLAIAAEARDPQMQYYTLVARFMHGDRDTSYMRGLAIKCRSFGDKKMALEIANNYIKTLGIRSLENERDLSFMTLFKQSESAKKILADYIQRLPQVENYTRSNIEVLSGFLEHSKDTIFHIFYKNARKLDSVLDQNDYAEKLIRYIIKKEEIQPAIKKASKNNSYSEINWAKIRSTIKQKYSIQYTKRCVLEGKVAAYSYDVLHNPKSWPKYIKYNIELIEKYKTDTTNGFSDATELNNFAYDGILLHSNNRRQILTAIRWMEGVVRRHPEEENNIDTYANLLHKAGRTEDALKWETKALEIALRKNSEDNISLYKQVIAKMKQKIPTWLDAHD